MKKVLRVILWIVLFAVLIALIWYAFKLSGFIKSQWQDLTEWFQKLLIWK